MTEEWKPIPGFDKRYEVSNKERLRNIKSKKILTNIPIRCMVNNDNKSQYVFFNRLVALAFIPNPDNLPYVIHINGKSNTPDNLKWGRKGDWVRGKTMVKKDINTSPIQRLDKDDNVLETYTDRNSMIKWIKDNCHLRVKTDVNIKKCIRNVCTGNEKQMYGYKWKYEFQEIEGEEWKKHPDDKFKKFEFSSEGRCKEKNRLLVGNITKEGYIKLTSNKSLLHRLIAQTFIPNLDNLPQVDHINENKSDNRVCNLRWCTAKQNNQYAHNKKVYQYSKDRKTFIKEFESTIIASKETKINNGNISSCIVGRYKSAGGYYWTHKILH